MDHAEESGYDKDFIMDSKGVLNVLALTIPVPLYWALYMQSVSMKKRTSTLPKFPCVFTHST